MNLIKRQIEVFSKSVRARQSLNLLLTNFVVIPMGILTSIILGKTLGAEGFGDYSFFISIFTFATLLATFGFFQAGNRALVLNNSKRRARQYYGAEIFVTIAIFLFMTLCLAVYCFIDPNIKDKGLVLTFFYALPLGFVFLADKFVETLLQADNRVGLISAYRFLTKLFFVFLLVFVWHTKIQFTGDKLLTILYGYFLAQIVVFLMVLLYLKPSFVSLKNRTMDLWRYNKSFGFNVYIGSVFAVGFASLSQILISYFTESNAGVGFYALALSLSAPLALIPNTIATVHYKDFSKQKRISRGLMLITLAVSVAALLALWLVVTPFIDYFYGNDFISVVGLSYIVSLGVLAHGSADFFNRFLGANGQAVALRNSSFLVGAGAMALGIMLIPLWGEYGAAITRLMAGFLYLGIIFWHYYSYTRRCEV